MPEPTTPRGLPALAYLAAAAAAYGVVVFAEPADATLLVHVPLLVIGVVLARLAADDVGERIAKWRKNGDAMKPKTAQEGQDDA